MFDFNFFKKIDDKNNYNLIIFDDNFVNKIINFLKINFNFKLNIIREIFIFDFFNINFLLFILNVNNRSFKINIFNIILFQISIIQINI